MSSPDARYAALTVRTRLLIAKEIGVARISASRAMRAVALFTAWLLVTWLGPEVHPPGGWTLWWMVGALAAYSVLTVGALINVWWWAMKLVRTGVLRRVVSAYFAPFWMVAAGCLCAGAAVWSVVGDPIAAVWLAIGCVFTMLTAAYGIARRIEVRRLEQDERQLAHMPSEIKLRTWSKELRARLDAHSSIRVDLDQPI